MFQSPSSIEIDPTAQKNSEISLVEIQNESVAKEEKDGVTEETSQHEQEVINLNHQTEDKFIPSTEKAKKMAPRNIQIEPTAADGYNFIEAKPKLGMEFLYSYFNSQLKYPKGVITKIKGEVLVNFTISKEGKVENINIEKSLAKEFDQEAIRVIRNMPQWLPATVNGTNVDSKLSIPLYFNISE